MTTIPRQLQMRRSHLDGLPPLEVPSGCELRTYQPGDEVHWARIMNQCIGQDWTPARCLKELVNCPQFRADGCFIASVNGVPQGSATAWVKPELEEDGYVHMVGVDPASRGKGLGGVVSLAVLHWFRDHGFRRAVLHTDDWRLPAIHIYLKLGFEPVLFDEHHRQRWETVGHKLSERP